MACDLVDVQYRVTRWRGLWRVRVNQRGSVDVMLAHVGLKY
jgi:hypothetical protein